MDLVTLHRRTVQGWLDRVEAVPANRWDDPTPCTEWTVRELVNHVVNEDLWTVPLLTGATIDEVGDRFDGDLLGDNPRAAAREAASAAVEVTATAVPAGGTVQLSYGPDSIDSYVGQLVADHLIHGWDLAVATGQDRHLDTDLVADVGAWYADREDSYRAAGVVGERTGTSADRTADLLAGFGRDASWQPPH